MTVAERSTNGGRSWEPFSYNPRALISRVMEGLKPGQVYDDGVGNLYRWRPEDDASC